MYHRPDIEALIVGAGPVGLYTAVLLSERGVPVQVIDEEWQTASRSYALALHPSTLSLLDEMDLTEALLPHGVRIDRVAYYRGTERLGEIDLGLRPGKFPFVLALPQSALEDTLEARLREAGVTVQWNRRLCDLTQSEDRVRAKIGSLAPAAHTLERRASEWIVEDTQSIHPRFVLGTDGHRSAVRSRLGISYEPTGPEERYLIFEFDCQADGGDSRAGAEARVVLDDSSTSVLWPLPSGRVRWSFGLASPEGDASRRPKSRIERFPRGAAFPDPTGQLLSDLLEDHAPWFRARPGEFHWSATVPFAPRLAREYGRGHVWLLGDAAHQASPVGVRSMNVALDEAREFVDRFESILLDRVSLDSLKEWSETRRNAWRRLVELEGTAAALPQAPEWIRGLEPRILSSLPASGPDLERYAGVLGVGLAGTVSSPVRR